MDNAKALRLEDLNHLYEAKYKGSDELLLFIEKVNLILCKIETRKTLKQEGKIEMLWREKFPGELLSLSFEITAAFKDAGWYVQSISPELRVFGLDFKTSPFTESELRSTGLCGL